VRVQCEDLSFAYDEGGRPIPAVAGVSFAIEPGQTVAVLGPSGSGKSTLLQLIKGLYEPQAGVVELDGLTSGDADFVARRREIGLVFQMAEMQLFASTARDDVAFGPRQLGWPPDEVEAAVTEALTTVGLPAAVFGERHPYSLSGGEQRRLALAGVLAMRPRLLLLDEPFVSLDPGARRELAAVLRGLVDGGMGLVLATHDVDQAWSLCERVLLLDGGRLTAGGTWLEVAGDEQRLAEHRLRPPFYMDLWRRLGRAVDGAPKSAAQAAEELA
jgi:energy-coupling factor transporter ATP-binding protein EcfA2